LIYKHKGEKVEGLCKEKSLNINLLKPLFELRMKGFNNKQIAEKIGVHRVTVQRYTSTLQMLKESEFEMLYKYILGDLNDRNNKT